MPQASSITLNDGANDVVFTPTSTNGKALYEARDHSVSSAGFPVLTAVLDRANVKRVTNKVAFAFSFPIETTVDGITTIRSVPRFFGDFVLPDDMSKNERTQFANLAVAALVNELMKGYVVDLEPVF